MHKRLVVTALGCLFLGACSEDRCAPLYDAAHDLCTRAANEVYFSRINASSHDCLQAYVAAHTELTDQRMELLSATSRIGVYKQLASLLSEQMAKRARDGSVSRLVSNLLYVEGLECSIVATDAGAFAKNTSLAGATFVAMRWWPILKYAAPCAALVMALMLYLASSRIRSAVHLRGGPRDSRRRESRRSTRFRTGTLVFSNLVDPEVSCIIMDRSSSGAQVRHDGPLPKAALMMFRDDADGKAYPASIAWRSGDRLGLRLFESNAARPAFVEPERFTLQRR
jgi:hypothetical protein